MSASNVSTAEQGTGVISEVVRAEALGIQKELYDQLITYEERGFVVGRGDHFFYVNDANGNTHQYDMPEAGLKIHIAVDWRDHNFLDLVRYAADVCAKRTRLDEVTHFKVMLPTVQASLPSGHTQRFKGITVYPTFLSGDAGTTNVPETVRLVRDLEKHFKGNQILFGRVIRNELRVGNGIFLRPGPLTRKAEEAKLGSTDYSLSFDAQLALLRDQVSPDMGLDFRRELIKVGRLKS